MIVNRRGNSWIGGQACKWIKPFNILTIILVLLLQMAMMLSFINLFHIAVIFLPSRNHLIDPLGIEEAKLWPLLWWWSHCECMLLVDLVRRPPLWPATGNLALLDHKASPLRVEWSGMDGCLTRIKTYTSFSDTKDVIIIPNYKHQS